MLSHDVTGRLLKEFVHFLSFGLLVLSTYYFIIDISLYQGLNCCNVENHSLVIRISLIIRMYLYVFLLYKQIQNPFY